MAICDNSQSRHAIDKVGHPNIVLLGELCQFREHLNQSLSKDYRFKRKIVLPARATQTEREQHIQNNHFVITFC